MKTPAPFRIVAQYALLIGLSVGTMTAIKRVADTSPVLAAIIGLIGLGLLFVHLLADAADRRDAARATELRAVIAYALRLHRIGDPGSIHLLRLYHDGLLHKTGLFPNWPQFLADFIRKDGDA